MYAELAQQLGAKADADIAGLQSAVTAAQTSLADAEDGRVAAVQQRDVAQTALQKVQADLVVAQTALQQAAQAKPAAVTPASISVGISYIPIGDLKQIAPLLRKDKQFIWLTPSPLWTVNNPTDSLECPASGVVIDAGGSSLAVTGKTGIAFTGNGCKVRGFTNITGNATAFRDDLGAKVGSGLTLEDCYSTGWGLVSIAGRGGRLINCGGKTVIATAFLCGSDLLVDNFRGDGSSDEHPLRITANNAGVAPSNITIRGGYFKTIANKEAIAVRNCLNFRLLDAALHGPLLLAQGAGAPPVSPYVSGVIDNCVFDWNGGAPGAQLDLRIASQIALRSSTFIITNPKQDRVTYGPSSILTTIGASQLQLAKGLTGGLFQGGGGVLAGQDQTIISFAA